MNSRSFLSLPYLKGLNSKQTEAVLSTEGPLLVLAGAGTGKTRVLTSRIAHILAQKKAFPRQILAVTFTNKAAQEIKYRVANTVDEIVMPWLGTFHSIGFKILRRHSSLVGLKSNFSILDNEDQIRLLKHLIHLEGIDNKRWPAKQLAQLINIWKNKALRSDDLSESEVYAFGHGHGRTLYELYQKNLKTLNACDLGDLLVECIRLFREYPDILVKYNQRFRYILVDEYQDTNIAQYIWLRLLVQPPKKRQVKSEHVSYESNISDSIANICCVGDDDQSIYGWRGAEIDNILRFDKDFPNAKLIQLQENYRSTRHILRVASHLITHNEKRLKKKLFTNLNDLDEEKVKISIGWDSEEEARTISDEIKNLQSKGHLLKNIAVLVRASFQMREFEDQFVSLGVNYRVVGGPRFYERREIRDAIAYFRLTCQPTDDLSFERIINQPKRGLGSTTIRIIRDYAGLFNISMLAASHELINTEELKPKQRKTLRLVTLNFSRWSHSMHDTLHTRLAQQILDESGYTKMWKNENNPESQGRLENLKELIRFMEAFESLHEFLEHVSLVTDSDKNLHTHIDAVNLMTLHSAKGLEFDTVFLPGWEEGLFPHQRSLDKGGRLGLEEERRLAYVGITRARKRANIWFVSHRLIHGQWQNARPSRFIEELPSENVEIVKTVCRRYRPTK
ncbi:ATP-dependent helicase [Candidatus Endowatersipora endosymbiont of Watersipora subatra]|uniref:ATP-dependent helicase n=1 Tax=Candidatus Endowatersipora endosymbiont of Watersipora subatra TaxID=3077946 RepID=UPI00312CA190